MYKSSVKILAGNLALSLILTLVITLVIPLGAPYSQAGVIAEQERVDQSTSSVTKSKIFISNNRLKFVELQSNMATIFDLNEGTMTQIDFGKKKYMKTRPEDYVKFIKKLKNKVRMQMEEQLKTMPPERRAQMEEMLQAQGILPSNKKSKPKKITIRATGQTQSIAGYSAEKFEVYKAGVLDEEIWISRDRAFTSEFDMKKMADFVKKLKSATQALGGAVDDEGEKMLVEKVYGKGFPLQSIEHSGFGTKIVEKVTKINVSSIPDDEFSVPAGYTKVTFEEMMSMTGK